MSGTADLRVRIAEGDPEMIRALFTALVAHDGISLEIGAYLTHAAILALPGAGVPADRFAREAARARMYARGFAAGWFAREAKHVLRDQTSGAGR